MGLLDWLKSRESGGPDLRVPEGRRGPVVRRRYRFSGTVQFVGFRYEAKLLADRLGLTGWARNETDGTVTVEAEGEAACVAEFLRAMRAVPRFDITDLEERDLPPLGAEAGFRILY